MNTLQLRAWLRRHDLTTSCVTCGVHASDQLPKTVEIPSIHIVNTDPSTESGEHWVAVYFGLDATEYFDSYGLPPPPTKNFLTFLGAHYDYNPVQLQGVLATTCGHYCLFYLRHRCRGFTMREIVDVFPGRGHNDQFVLKWFHRQRAAPKRRYIDTI